MKTWAVDELDVRPHLPEILSSSDEGRAIVIHLPAGQLLQDHEVHERAWLTVVSGTISITTPAGDEVEGGPGLLAEFDPRERHEVRASEDARLLLLLTPWPGKGHPGTLTLEQKAEVRREAAAHRKQ